MLHHAWPTMHLKACLMSLELMPFPKRGHLCLWLCQCNVRRSEDESHQLSLATTVGGRQTLWKHLCLLTVPCLLFMLRLSGSCVHFEGLWCSGNLSVLWSASVQRITLCDFMFVSPLSFPSLRIKQFYFYCSPSFLAPPLTLLYIYFCLSFPTSLVPFSHTPLDSVFSFL